MTERHTDHQPRRGADRQAGARCESIAEAEVTGRRIRPAALHRLRAGDAELPTLAEWTERDVWVPPERAGARP